MYDSSNAHERFEAELDKALEEKVDFIIIEPPRLGDETGKLTTWSSLTSKIIHKVFLSRSLDLGWKLST